jgi:hypothetical protein
VTTQVLFIYYGNAYDEAIRAKLIALLQENRIPKNLGNVLKRM